MKQLTTVAALNSALDPLRGRARIAFVPTMGNLHEGHLTLVRHAREQADHVVVSIFVNPLQFGPDEDLATYPRTLERDVEQLTAVGADVLFVPGVEVIYPKPQSEQTRVQVPIISDMLCGATRPGHFDGVATVVCKLFNLVRPDVALFGQKDYQQLMVIRRMVEDLALPVQVIGVPTIREADGLAMSSRNGYLDAEQRRQAPALYRILSDMAAQLLAGQSPAKLVEAGAQAINAAGLNMDYLAIRRQSDLAEPLPGDEALVILVAAWLGETRLIDNIEIKLMPPSAAD